MKRFLSLALFLSLVGETYSSHAPVTYEKVCGVYDGKSLPRSQMADAPLETLMRLSQSRWRRVPVEKVESEAYLAKLQREVLAALPSVKGEGFDAPESIRKYFSTLFPADKVTIDKPATPGMSGEPVYIVKVNGVAKFAAKTFHADGKSFSQELAGTRTLMDATETVPFQTTEILDVFHLRQGDEKVPVSIMRLAPGQDIRVILDEALRSHDPSVISDAQKNFTQLAQTLARIHQKFLHPNHGRDSQSGFVEYEINKARSLWSHFPRDAYLKSDFATEAEVSALGQAIEKRIADYSEAGLTFTSVSHGDFHLGNSLCTPKSCTIIDNVYIPLSQRTLANGQTIGTSDPLTDVGRMIEAIGYEATFEGKGPAEAASFQENFLKSYLAERKLKQADVQASLNFHRLRYALFQTEERSRLNPRQRCLVLNLLLLQLAIRTRSEAQRCQ